MYCRINVFERRFCCCRAELDRLQLHPNHRHRSVAFQIFYRSLWCSYTSYKSHNNINIAFNLTLYDAFLK